MTVYPLMRKHLLFLLALPLSYCNLNKNDYSYCDKEINLEGGW